MKQILIVDDERHVLDAARDVLQRRTGCWDVHFASDAATALNWMTSRRFDVVIADSTLPDVEGVTILAHVKVQQPSAARVVMAEPSQRVSVLRALPAAQQFLSKPLDPATLLVTIERACHVRHLLASTTLRDLVGRIDHLPSVPSLYQALTAAAANPDATIEMISAIVERDPAVSLKILQLVNSAYFGAPQRATSVQQAVSRLGVEMVKALALSTHAFGALTTAPFEGFSAEMLQRHSFMTARLAKEVAATPASAAEAFTAALLHDIGKLVLAVGTPQLLAEILREHRRSRRPHYLIEQESLGVTHAEVGAYLLATWGLPLTLVEAVAFHHRPCAVDGNTNATLAAVHIADALMDPEPYVTGDQARHGKLDRVLVEQTALAAKVPEWRARVARLQAGFA